jgi:hypothetical protein
MSWKKLLWGLLFLFIAFVIYLMIRGIDFFYIYEKYFYVPPYKDPCTINIAPATNLTFSAGRYAKGGPMSGTAKTLTTASLSLGLGNACTRLVKI